MIFEEVGEQVKAALGRRQRRLRRKIRTMGRGETLHAFEKIGAARKPARGKTRREQPILRGFSRVEGLAHRAELRFEPGRLGSGDAQRHRRGLSIEVEQARTRRRRSKAADRRGRVETERVMPGLQRHADTANGLVASDKGGDDLASRATLQLGEGEQPRQDRDRGMAWHRQVDIVVIEGMTRRTIDQCRRQRGQPHAMTDDARLRRPAGFRHLVEQHADQLISGARHRAAEIVEHALPRQLAHGLG